jgi:hypothetical protein
LNLFAFCTKNLDIFLDPLAWLFTKPSSVFLWHVLGLGKKIDEAVETKGGHVVRPRRCEGSALPATQKATQTKEHQCVHPTPCKTPSAATRKPLETKGRQEPPEPVQSRKCCPFLAKAAETGRQGVHPQRNMWDAFHAKPYPQIRRNQGTPANVRPLAKQQVLRAAANATVKIWDPGA